MSLKILAETYLASTKRKRELRVESDSAYGNWANGVDNEMKVFFSRAHELDLKKSSDRNEFYNLVKKLTSQLRIFRNDHDARLSPPEAIRELDEFTEYLDGVPPSAASSSTSLKKDPWTQARHEREKKEQEQKRMGQATKEFDEVAAQIVSLREKLEEGG